MNCWDIHFVAPRDTSWLIINKSDLEVFPCKMCQIVLTVGRHNGGVTEGLQTLKQECRQDDNWFQAVADDGVLSAIACQFNCRWMGWPALKLWQVTCLLSLCMCMCEVTGSEIGRNTGITGRSGAVKWDGCKTSPLALKSRTHMYTQRWRDLSPEAPTLQLPCTDTHVLRCKCTCTLHYNKTDVRVRACALYIQTYVQTFAMQSVFRLNICFWAAPQSAGLMKRYHVLQ